MLVIELELIPNIVY